MKRLIPFVLVLALAVTFLAGAGFTIYSFNDDVTVDAVPVYGDPKVVEGITTQLTAYATANMMWHAVHTAGNPGVTESEFIFSQDSLYNYEFGWEFGSEFSYSVEGNFGVGSSGGIEIAEDSALGDMIRAVAQEVQPNGAVTKTLNMADYMDYYTAQYYTSLYTPKFSLDETWDSMRGRAYGYEAGSYGSWSNAFRFPVGDYAQVEITVEKNGAGELCGVNVMLVEADEFHMVTEIREAGMYFAPVFQDWQGNPLSTGEYIYGYGLYYIPFKVDSSVEYVGEEGVKAGKFDFDNLELVYGMENEELLIAMQSDENDMLHMLTREEGVYRYSTLDLRSGTVVHQLDIMSANADGWSDYHFFPEQDLIWFASDGRVALLQTGENPTLELVVEYPEELSVLNPSSVSYRDGVLYAAVLDWVPYMDAEYTKAWCLTAVDAQQVLYHGNYITSLRDSGHTYAYMDQYSIEIIE